jgi:hypothetical protein
MEKEKIATPFVLRSFTFCCFYFWVYEGTHLLSRRNHNRPQQVARRGQILGSGGGKPIGANQLIELRRHSRVVVRGIIWLRASSDALELVEEVRAREFHGKDLLLLRALYMPIYEKSNRKNLQLEPQGSTIYHFLFFT